MDEKAEAQTEVLVQRELDFFSGDYSEDTYKLTGG